MLIIELDPILEGCDLGHVLCRLRWAVYTKNQQTRNTNTTNTTHPNKHTNKQMKQHNYGSGVPRLAGAGLAGAGSICFGISLAYLERTASHISKSSHVIVSCYCRVKPHNHPINDRSAPIYDRSARHTFLLQDSVACMLS